jgi:hypothetical protein
MEKSNHNKITRLKSRTVAAALTGLGSISALVYAANFRIYNLSPVFAGLSGIEFYVIIFLFLSAFYLAGLIMIVKLLPARSASWSLVFIIVLFGILFRLGLVPSEPTVLSRDRYRYIWYGRLQQNGMNPYRYAPGADELAALRDEVIYPNINRKEYPTLYPAGAQLFFRLFYTLVGDSAIGYKAIMVFFDTLTLIALIALLRSHGFAPSRVIVYAWNPLVIFEIAYSGHLEGLTIFLMVAALYLSAIRKKISGIIMLALSAAVKFYPALLLAAFLNRGDRIKGLLAFSVTMGIVYLPFLGAGSKISGFLPVYLKNPYESFNLGLKYLLMRLLPGLDYYLLSLVFITALAIAGLVVLFKDKQKIDVLQYAYVLAGLLMVLMPASLHPWYVILIIPFLAFYPHPAWLVFATTVSLSYLKYVSAQGTMPTWILLVEYLPLFALLATGHILGRYAGRVHSGGMNFSQHTKKMIGL